MMEKKAGNSKTKKRNLDAHTTCIVNIHQRKVAGVLFWLNHSIHQLALALYVIPVICLDGIQTVGTIFQLCYGKHNSMHILCYSLSWTASR